jgi:hypothetical protein
MGLALRDNEFKPRITDILIFSNSYGFSLNFVIRSETQGKTEILSRKN